MTIQKENSSDLMEKITAQFGHNASYVLSLFSQFQADPGSLTGEWQNYFQSLSPSTNGTNGAGVQHHVPSQTTNATNASVTTVSKPVVEVKVEGQALPMRGAARKLVDNMEVSLSVPTATSQRQIPLKVLEENRRLINEHLTSQHMSKISFTHIIAWAIVKALKTYPRLNDAFAMIDGQPNRIQRPDVNIGLAVDVPKPDGSRSLLVPNIKKSNEMDFAEFFDAYNKAVRGARVGNLPVTAYQDTSITLTNPGTIGTTASNARLMAGQGVIIATGSIDYPPHYQGMAEEALSQLGISKVCTLASTYDHRIVQGAESGSLLAEIHRLLIGEGDFYEQIFLDLQVPYPPVKWAVDRYPTLLGNNLQGEAIDKQARVLELITAYRLRGHLAAHVNPLEKHMPHHAHPELTLEHYGLTIWDLDREFFTGGLVGTQRATLRNILAMLRKTYCDKVGIEFRHLPDLTEREWLRSRIEAPRGVAPIEVRMQILKKLIAAEYFERFIHTKYLGQKRFSVEGGEISVALLDQLIELAGANGVKDITIGMSHRGRLNVLSNVVGKFCERIFSIFEGSVHPDFAHDQGDVKYHQGAIGTKKTTSSNDVTVSVVSNPSHLEFVDPVVEGIVRAKQDALGNSSGKKVLPVLIHGDAAFAGEGIVPETLSLSRLKAYQTGGTIHIVINNQIGFTTSPESARSSLYCTDIAKMTETPIFHVNSDEPDVAYWVLKLAFEFRQEFQKDVVIDLVGFRRHGHNEGDEPSYTQPVMYQIIKQHPGVCKLYSDRLIKEGLITAEDFAELIRQRMARYESAQLTAKEITQKQHGHHEIICSGSIDDRHIMIETPDTKLSQEEVSVITKAISTIPEGFQLNPKIKPLINRRTSMGEGKVALDWGFAELLAYGSLALEGTHVRLTGQDCIRGTFSQRHSGYYDNDTNELWMPLQHLSDSQAPCEIYDSLLSEAAVMGFEYGYSVASPESLVLWEAQFGDFANTAQVIMDQFIAAGEEKWHQFSRLVLLLPHGFEGQGPEHSSARIERFLQLCANYNWQICQCTTPAQYFHLLRRQIKQQAAKPLVIFTPKSLLRLLSASSPLEEIINGQFHPVIDGGDQTEPITRVVLCSGKVYYDLLAERKNESTRIVRLEQFYPFPYKALSQTIARFSQASDWVWAQEEPKNMGGWTFVNERLAEMLPNGRRLRYAGRAAAASPATGSHHIHQLEQKELVRDALGLA